MHRSPGQASYLGVRLQGQRARGKQTLTFRGVGLLQASRAHAVQRQLLRWRAPPSQSCIKLGVAQPR